MKVVSRLLLALTFTASASFTHAGTEAEWTGRTEPKREIASESLEETLRSWDRADYSSNLTEEERVEREVIEAEGPVRPLKKYAAQKSSNKKIVAKKSSSKKLAKKNQKKVAKKLALNDKKRIRR